LISIHAKAETIEEAAVWLVNHVAGTPAHIALVCEKRELGRYAWDAFGQALTSSDKYSMLPRTSVIRGDIICDRTHVRLFRGTEQMQGYGFDWIVLVGDVSEKNRDYFRCTAKGAPKILEVAPQCV
jgi:hypothetical protein